LGNKSLARSAGPFYLAASRARSGKRTNKKASHAKRGVGFWVMQSATGSPQAIQVGIPIAFGGVVSWVMQCVTGSAKPIQVCIPIAFDVA